jgi:phosphoketolase
MNSHDELNQSTAVIDVTDHIARKNSGTTAVMLTQTAEVQATTLDLAESVCEDGVCTVTWKPARPAA